MAHKKLIMEVLKNYLEHLFLKQEWLDTINAMNIQNPLWPWGVGAFATLIILEILVSLKYDKELYEWKDFSSSLSMGLGSVFIAVFSKVGGIAAFFFVYDFFNPIVSEGVTAPLLDYAHRVNIIGGYSAFGFQWYMFVICQFWDDFNYYWHHRLSHTVRLLWAAHIVHHSSDRYNLGTAVRNGWFTLFYKPIFWLWLPAIGFHPVMVATCLGIQALWQFQLHSKFIPHLGFLEIFMNTHKQHQAHHSQNVAYLDKNNGGYLNIFDRIFGSHVELDEENDAPQFGVIHPPESHNPFVIVSHEYKDIWNDVKKAKSFKEALMYIFGPPGWSPDGSTLTARQMQRKLAEEKKQAA